jgi:hypothetical protein
MAPSISSQPRSRWYLATASVRLAASVENLSGQIDQLVGPIDHLGRGVNPHH